MYYAMVFHRDPTSYAGTSTIRSVRPGGYRTLDAAIQAVVKKDLEGYVRKQGISKPVWNNVR